MDVSKTDVSRRPQETSGAGEKVFKKYQVAAEVLEEHMEKNTRYVIYRNEVFDAGNYLDNQGHPGGEAAIAEYYGRDVTEIMHKKNHSKTAYRLLKGLKVGEIEQKIEYEIDTKNGKNSLLKGHSLISEEMAEKLEKKFDLQKPIFGQILNPKLTLEEYLAFITEPKIMPDPNKQIRIFESDFFEAFSSTKWYAVPLVWMPVMFIVGCIVAHYLPEGYTAKRAIGWYIYGIFHWTLTEYLLHRFLFHIDGLLPTNGWVFGVHFLIHGIHHAFPQDPGRLVFPIINAFFVGLAKFGILLTIFGWPDAFWSEMDAFVSFD